jgi:uncharacterized protein HemX
MDEPRNPRRRRDDYRHRDDYRPREDYGEPVSAPPQAPRKPTNSLWEQMSSIGSGGMLLFVIATAAIGGIVATSVNEATTNVRLSQNQSSLQQMQDTLTKQAADTKAAMDKQAEHIQQLEVAVAKLTERVELSQRTEYARDTKESEKERER